MHKILFYNNFIICLYMFRALCTHHQEVKIVLYIHNIWYCHICRWPPLAQVEKGVLSLSLSFYLCTGRQIYIFDHISFCSLPEWNMFQTKGVEGFDTYFMFSNCYCKLVSLWDNVEKLVGLGSPRMERWCLRIACCIPKATINTQVV